MLLSKNPGMDYIPLDDGGLIVFDPETGNTHFLDDIGYDILNTLETPKGIDEMLAVLSQSYLADVNEIKKDITDFVKDLLEKQVLLRDWND